MMRTMIKNIMVIISTLSMMMMMTNITIQYDDGHHDFYYAD